MCQSGFDLSLTVDLVGALAWALKGCRDETCFLETSGKCKLLNNAGLTQKLEPTERDKRPDGHNVMSQLGGCPEPEEDTLASYVTVTIF